MRLLKTQLILVCWLVLLASQAWAQIPLTLGWHNLGSATVLRTVGAYESNPTLYQQIHGVSGTDDVTAAWNGGALDTKRNRLLIWGGGHNGYYGNEIYALNLNNTPINVTRLNNPTLPGAGSTCLETLTNDGTNGFTAGRTAPNSRHTYSNLQYIPYQDKFLTTPGGSVSCPPSAVSGATWTADLAMLASNPNGQYWTNQNPTGTPPSGSSAEARPSAYDRNTGAVFFHNDFFLYKYSPVANTWQRWGPDAGVAQVNMCAVIDPVRKTFWMFGRGVQYKWDISTGIGTGTRSVGGTTGDLTIVNAYGPGCEYDPVQDRIVGWNTGDSVQVLNLNTLVWSTVTFSGGPSNVAGGVTNGVWSRFRYAPAVNAFVVCNDVDSPCYALRLTAADTAEHDFVKRSYESGVVRAVGFESTAETTGNYGAERGTLAGTSTIAALDSAVKSSGANALRFTVPTLSNHDAAGSWWTNFSADLATQFGAGQEFWISWRQRWSPCFLYNGADDAACLANGAAGGLRTFTNAGGWKLANLGTGDKPGCTPSSTTNCFSSCNDLEIVPQNTNHRRFLQGYQSCPGPNTTNFDDTSMFGQSDPLLQNSRPSPFCRYSQGPSGGGAADGTGFFPPNGNCLAFVPNEWISFKIHVQLGTRSGSYLVGTVVDYYMARDGQPWTQTHHWTSWGTPMGSLPGSYIGTSASDQKYGKLWLTPYNTGKVASQSHPTLFTWYDEVIISRNDIAAPGAVAAPPTIATQIKVIRY